MMEESEHANNYQTDDEKSLTSYEGEEEQEEEEEVEDEYDYDYALEEEDFDEETLQDLFDKNTKSFTCLAQILISRSSLLRHILYHFPPLVDPGIDEAFNYVEPEPTYDDIGCEKYRNLCIEIDIVPITRVLRSLRTDTLNLKYYGLSFNQTKAICSTMMLNNRVEHMILEDNWMTPDAVFWIGEMLRENNSVKILNMRECRIGPEGIYNIMEGLSLNQCLRELDLSFNNLGDEGVLNLLEAMKENQLIQKLNLSHNNLGVGTGKNLGKYLASNATMDFLDLSWNDLYPVAALKPLCLGLSENTSIKYLNLAWNGIGIPEAVLEILRYMKATAVLEHLDLSNNRLVEVCWRMIRAGIIGNTSLQSINLGFNLMTPDEAIFMVQAFTMEDLRLEYMDLENVFVKRNFRPLWRRVTRMGKNVRIQGFLSDYRIAGPKIDKVYFDRCKFLAQKPKRKKQKKNFGWFMLSLADDPLDKKKFRKAVRKFKLKFDKGLIEGLQKRFTLRGDLMNIERMKKSFMDLYPDTEPPPPKKKKRKRKRKKKKGDSGSESTTATSMTTPTEDKGTETSRTTSRSGTEPLTDTEPTTATISTTVSATRPPSILKKVSQATTSKAQISETPSSAKMQGTASKASLKAAVDSKAAITASTVAVDGEAEKQIATPSRTSLRPTRSRPSIKSTKSTVIIKEPTKDQREEDEEEKAQ